MAIKFLTTELIAGDDFLQVSIHYRGECKDNVFLCPHDAQRAFMYFSLNVHTV
jgi:hypothetical protein